MLYAKTALWNQRIKSKKNVMNRIILRIKTVPFVQASLRMKLIACSTSPVYTAIRQKYIPEFIDQEVPPLLKTLLEAPSAIVSRKVAMHTFYALECREERLV